MGGTGLHCLVFPEGTAEGGRFWTTWFRGWGEDRNKDWTVGGEPLSVLTRGWEAVRVFGVLLLTGLGAPEQWPSGLSLGPATRSASVQLCWGAGPEQSSPSLDQGLKYPPESWPHHCCPTKPDTPPAQISDLDPEPRPLPHPHPR